MKLLIHYKHGFFNIRKRSFSYFDSFERKFNSILKRTKRKESCNDKATDRSKNFKLKIYFQSNDDFLLDL